MNFSKQTGEIPFRPSPFTRIEPTTSVLLAQAFGKQHKTVLRDIANPEIPEEFHRENFRRDVYTDERGTVQPMYQITGDGIKLLIMGFKGKRAAAWKEEFVEAMKLGSGLVDLIEDPVRLS